MSVSLTHPMVEATMVCLGEGHDKLARTLIACIYRYTCLLEAFRGHQRDKLEEQIGLRVEEIRSLTPQSLLKLLCRRPWDAVPRLGLAPVHWKIVGKGKYARRERLTIVDAIRIMILVVPAKRGEHHADISPRNRHAGDISLNETKE